MQTCFLNEELPSTSNAAARLEACTEGTNDESTFEEELYAVGKDVCESRSPCKSCHHHKKKQKSYKRLYAGTKRQNILEENSLEVAKWTSEGNQGKP